MTDSLTGAQVLEILQSRASTYSFLSHVYRQEATVAFLQELREQLVDSAEESAGSEGYETLRDYMAALDPALMDGARQELATEYASMFLNAGPVHVYVYESVYTDPERLVMQDARDQVLAEYRKEGLDRTDEFREPEDHIAIELEFMAYLCQKASDSLEAGDSAGAVAYLRKQEDFLKKHLLVWVPEFCANAIQAAETGFYRGVAQITGELLADEADTIAELLWTIQYAGESE